MEIQHLQMELTPDQMARRLASAELLASVVSGEVQSLEGIDPRATSIETIQTARRLLARNVIGR